MDPDQFSDELLNTSLELTTEWGENYGKPINERILAAHPELPEYQINELTKRSREAEYYIYALAERELAGEITEGDIVSEALRKYGWLSTKNAARLKSIGMFYARK